MKLVKSHQFCSILYFAAAGAKYRTFSSEVQIRDRLLCCYKYHHLSQESLKTEQRNTSVYEKNT